MPLSGRTPAGFACSMQSFTGKAVQAAIDGFVSGKTPDPRYRRMAGMRLEYIGAGFVNIGTRLVNIGIRLPCPPWANFFPVDPPGNEAQKMAGTARCAVRTPQRGIPAQDESLPTRLPGSLIAICNLCSGTTGILHAAPRHRGSVNLIIPADAGRMADGMCPAKGFADCVGNPIGTERRKLCLAGRWYF